MTSIPAPLRLRLDADALAANWRALDRLSGSAACGAAVKADGYGLGAGAVTGRLASVGARDFFVATWGEAVALAPSGLSVSVLHGVRDEDMPTAREAAHARPVLNTRAQVERWRAAGGGPCDAMVDTGMHRLGLAIGDVEDGILDGLPIDTLMSHLACADDAGDPMNRLQRDRFAALGGRTAARRMSLANSAGIALGPDYAFDLVRPGLALYGGVPCAALERHLRQVVWPEAEILQRRRVARGGTVGYNATWHAPVDTEVAIVNLGYADGYFRGFSDRGQAAAGKTRLPVIGRVSMDLVAIDVTAAPDLAEGDWLPLDYALPGAARASGMSQYELLTALGPRYDRVWSDAVSGPCHMS